MTSLLCKWFIKDRDKVHDPNVRRSYGTLAAVVGIILNLLLFLGKFVIGTLTGSVSIRADGVNNLSDAASQIITLISFRVSAKPADRGHPFGHARIEYVASMIVSMLILVIGYRLLRDSIDKIITPVATEFRVISVLVLAVSVAAKLWLGLFNRKIGNRIDSDVMRATMIDSLSDAAATSAVLISTLILRFTGFDTDAYMGVLVAVLILIAGIKVLCKTKDSILGEAPSEDIVRTIRDIVAQCPEALGIHDLVVHNYGPGRVVASLHVEVDGNQTAFQAHDITDWIETRLREDAGITATIHMDPIALNDPMTNTLRARVSELLTSVDSRLGMHDFRVVPGTAHSHLIFDVTAPFELKMSNDALREEICRRIDAWGEGYLAVLTVDRV